MTSASGESFRNVISEPTWGDMDVMLMLAVDVGDRCRVRGCGGTLDEGFGSALICACKFVSKNPA